MRHPLSLTLLPPLLLTLSACAGTGAEDSNIARDKVIGGAVESGEPATLMLEWNGQLICTATLIAPRVALTAAHCVYSEGEYSVPTSASVVLNGAKTETAQVADYAIHGSWTGDNLSAGVDIALLYLSAPLSPTPIMVDRVPGAQRTGQVGKIVGFGRTTSTDRNSVGVKNSVRLQVVGTSGDNGSLLQLRSPDSTYRASCSGDSGGPFFIGEGAQRVVAGVTSFGYGVQGDPCREDSFYVSTAYHATWINENLNGRTTGVREVGASPSRPQPPANPNGGYGGYDGSSAAGYDNGGYAGYDGSSAGYDNGGYAGYDGSSAGYDNGGYAGYDGSSAGYDGSSAGYDSGFSGWSCRQMFDCFGTCGDSTTCIEQCYYDSTATAQSQFDAISGCNDSMACAWDGTCLGTYCVDEINGCL
jgi:hypothetical protein